MRTIEVVPDADVTLQVRNGVTGVNIKVSGLVLSLTSKVFKAMLNSQFVESSKVVNVQETDPDSMLNLCYIIHHQTHSVKSMDGAELKNLTALIDLWDVRQASEPYLFAELGDYLTWFRRSKTSSDFGGEPFPAQISGLEIEDFITFSAMFGLDDLFWQVTRAYLEQSDHGISPDDPARLATKAPLYENQGTSIYCESAFIDQVLHC